MFRRKKNPEAAAQAESEAAKTAEEKEKPKRRYQITLYFLGAGAPISPSGTSMDWSEQSREDTAKGMMAEAGADDYELTDTGINIIFRGTEKETWNEAIIFGRAKGVRVEDAYSHSVRLDPKKEEQGVMAIPYIEEEQEAAEIK